MNCQLVQTKVCSSQCSIRELMQNIDLFSSAPNHSQLEVVIIPPHSGIFHLNNIKTLYFVLYQFYQHLTKRCKISISRKCKNFLGKVVIQC